MAANFDSLLRCIPSSGSRFDFLKAVAATLLAGLLLMRSATVAVPAEQPTVEQQAENFLHEYYKIFEISEQDQTKARELAAAGLTDDFTAIFHIPSQKKELLHFDKKSIVEGFANAFALYQGRHPVMTVTNIKVLRRSEDEAVVSYQMNFYLEGQLRNDALAIADVRREGGSWRMYRLYENKRR